MPFGQSLQGAPKWYSDYAEDLLKKLQQSYDIPYESFRNVSKEKNEATRKEIDRLIELQKGKRLDIIPFSITGSSKPININPFALRKISEDENFARKVYESATGYSHISREEIQDLRKRAIGKYESSLPEIRQLIQPQIKKLEPNLNPLRIKEQQIQSQISPLRNKENQLQSEINPLESEKSNLKSRLKDLDKEERRIYGLLLKEQEKFPTFEKKPLEGRAALYNPAIQYQEQLRNIDSESKKFQSQLSQIDLNKSKLQSQLGNVSSERQNLEKALQEEVRKLSQERQPPEAAEEEYREPVEPQYEDFPSSEISSPEDIIKMGSTEREINALSSPQGRIAPMNITHARSKSIVERGIDDDSMELAKDELRESKKHDELKAVEPYVRASLEGPSDKYMREYVDDYTKDIRKAIQDESEEEWLKKIAPKINMSFAQMGAFHSGARNKALKDAASEHRVKLHRELAHLTGSATDKRMEQHELQKRREQSAAHLMGHTTKSQKEASQRQAELFRQHAVTKKSLSHMDAAALGQLAKAEQDQLQHEIDAEAQEFKRQQLHKQEQLERQAMITSGIAPTASHTITSEFNPSPPGPNPFTTGAALTATAASAFGQPKKEGGSVRKKYADGGSIGSNDIGNEIRNIIQEQNKAGQSHLEEISNQNPMQGWLRHVGREMLSNPREDPLLSLGRGTSNAMDHRDMMRERSKNLYDKIQTTKLNQYRVLAEYENMKDKLAFNREQLGETKRGHDIMREISLGKQNAVRDNPKKSSADKKMEDKALENIIENHEMKNDLILMDDAIKKSTLGTGPWLGRGKSFLGIDNEIDVLGNHIVTKANKLYGRGGGSNLQLKTLQGGKPGQNLSKEANETIIKKYGQESDRRINKNVAYLIKSGWTPEEISQATGIQFPDGTPENAHNSNMESAQLSEGQNDPFSAWRPQE